MKLDCKARMAVWCLLSLAAVALVIVVGMMLFFQPGHAGGPLDKSDQSRPAQTTP